MRWSLLVAVFGLSTLDVASFAQGPPDGERLSTPRSASDDAGFFASSGVVRFQLVQGRLALDCPRHRKGSQSLESDGVYESITVTAKRGIPSLHYVWQSETQHLTLSVQHATSMRIESWFPMSGQRAVLEQPELGKVTWENTQGDIADKFEGTNLLHLRHANQIEFDHHFGVLIQRLLRGQTLQALSESTQQAMLNHLELASTLDEEQIRHWVDQLRCDRRTARLEAERQLLACGTPIVPTLHRLVHGDIDAEQRERIRMILKRLRPMIDDTPVTLAMLLVNDRSYWSRIAHELNHDQLHLANRHLQAFGVEPIPAAPEPLHRIADSRD